MWTALPPSLAALLADGMLLLHVGVVVFVVLGQLMFMWGAWRGWAWVRHWPLRVTHLLLMLFIALQAWLGRLCPLTVWEQALRAQAGQVSYGESFMAHWLGRLLYWNAPWWVFVAAYTGFAALVALTWWWAPPRARHSPRHKR